MRPSHQHRTSVRPSAAGLTLGVFLVLAMLLPTRGNACEFTELEKACFSLSQSDASDGTTARLSAVLRIAPEWHTNSHTPTFDYLIPTTLVFELPEGWGPANNTYPDGQMVRFAFVEQPISVYTGETTIDVAIPTTGMDPNQNYVIRAALRYQACDDTRCLPPVTTHEEISLAVPGGTTSSTSLPASASSPVSSRTPLLPMLALAVLGGLILNIMPCVLPVLSLKLLSLAGKAGARRGEVVTGAVATTAGILFSFWALALAAVAARTTGLVVGWGVQFQEPGFVAFLAVVVVLFCLNLWGVFEINLPQRLAGIATRAPHEGITGHFATGLFATLMATPCTAPALGTAVSFALSQDAVTVFAMFSAVGIGMALPYLVLAVLPQSTRWLPRPGEWMLTLRVILGFLLAASAVWLLYVLSAQISAERLVVFQLVLLMMALLLWSCSRFRRTALRRAGGLGALATMVLAIGLVTQAQPPANAGATLSHGLIPWVPFDRENAEQLARDGRLVFVDVTADWCLTCKANEGFVLETERIAGAFDRLRVVPMKADWTNPDASIAQFLMDHGRPGIPFYVLYGPGTKPHVFGELLTKQAVLDALERAQQAIARAGGGTAGTPRSSALVDDLAVQDR